MKTSAGRAVRRIRIGPWVRRAQLELAPRAAAMLLLAAVLGAAACGGGGGGGGSPTNPPPPQSGLSFTPSGSGPGISLTTLAGSQGTTLGLAVQSSGIQDLYGVAFHLTYPYTVMHFTGAVQGSLLSANGSVPTSFQIVEAPLGTLIVGLTRLGAVQGTNAPGALMNLQFTAVANGSGPLSFVANQANDSLGNVLTGISWNAGSVQSVISGSTSAPLH
jgi:hypothetical protein